MPAEPDRDLAPAFALKALDGQTVSSDSFRGRWLLVNFWATWCGPCVDEMPYLQTLAAAHPERLAVVGINQRERAQVVAAFAADAGITFPLLLDPDDAVLLQYNVLGLPLTAVVAPDGTLERVIRGPLQPADFGPWLETTLAN